LFQHARGNLAQLEIIHLCAAERDRQNRYVIHVDRLDHRLCRTGWQAVEVFYQLVVDPYQAAFLILADVEFHCHHAEIRHSIAVGVFDAGLRVHDRFERLDYQILNFTD